MKELKIDEKLAYDIGAFDGDTTGMISSLGYEKIVCFEPDPEAFERMKRQISGNVIFLNLAVSDVSGKKVKMITVPGHPYLSSLESTWFSTSRHPMDNFIEIEVETISLNDYIEESGAIPAYIKVDAEGHELSIFKGLNYKPTKLSFEWVSEFYEKNESCLKLLCDIGFDKFIICHKENLPTIEDKTLSIDECLSVLKSFNISDTERIVWGNIWCS